MENEKKLRELLDKLNAINTEFQKLRSGECTEEDVIKTVQGKFGKKKYKIGGTPCNRCGGLISWDLRPERIAPLHVDEHGYQVGEGDCPLYEKEG